MKLLGNRIKASITPAETSSELMYVVPLVMRTIRGLMRQHQTADLTLPQFRALAFLNRRGSASLTDVAEHLGLALPSTSKLIDGLVERKLVTREFDRTDRRRVTLGLDRRGHSLLQVAIRAAQTHLSERLARLSPNEMATVVQAMHLLRLLFASEREREIPMEKRNDSHS